MKIKYNPDFLEFLKRYFLGVYPYQRLGQAFCNKFNIQDSELFYCESDKVAQQIILDKYVEY